MRLATAVLIGLALVLPNVSAAQADGPRAVLVTGASSGIGRKITEHLSARGFFVYAGARKPADLAALNAIKNVQAIRLDVTKQEEIDAALETITKAGRGLYGLVNNAGVGSVGAVAETKMEEFDTVMQVNVYGPFRVTKAFIPLITASKGRITTIGSIVGILAPGRLPAYSMSKHAVEAFGDSLAAQMAPLGVQVSIVEPGNYDSDLGRNALARTGLESPMVDRSKYKKPDEVAMAVEQALSEATPKRRYLVVPELREGDITIRKQIEQLVQLNEGHAYTYDRDALVKMLDEALAKSRPKVVAEASAAK